MKSENQTRVNDYLVIIIFLAIISFPLVAQLFDFDLEAVNTENRSKATLPDISLTTKSIREYPKNFETYFNDNFGMRDLLIRGYNYLSYFCFSKSPSDRVLIGKEGWLFYSAGHIIEEYRGIKLLTNNQLHQWRKVLMQRQDNLKAHDIHYLFVVPPNKHSIYSEYLPDYITKVGDITPLDQIASLKQNCGQLPFLDLRPPILKAKLQNPMFYKFDTHWNKLAGYFAYKEIISEISNWYPELHTLEFDKIKFIEKTDIASDMARMIGLPDILKEPRQSIKAQLYARKSKIQIVELSDKYKQIKLRSKFCNKSRLRAVVFHDSFVWAFASYFSECFSEILFIQSRYNQDIVNEILAQYKPDIIIEECVERKLRQVPKLN